MNKIKVLSSEYREILRSIKLNQSFPSSESGENIISKFIHDVDKIQNASVQALKDNDNGESSDVHQVMLAAEEADRTYQLMMEIRNSLLESYREIMRLQI